MALVHSPKIVTDNLIFYADAVNIKSYPGTPWGVWYDMGSSGFTGSLTNFSI